MTNLPPAADAPDDGYNEIWIGCEKDAPPEKIPDTLAGEIVIPFLPGRVAALDEKRLRASRRKPPRSDPNHRSRLRANRLETLTGPLFSP